MFRLHLKRIHRLQLTDFIIIRALPNGVRPSDSTFPITRFTRSGEKKMLRIVYRCGFKFY